MPFLHELSDSKDLFELISEEQGLLPIIVEKDYWLMHCLWGLQQQGLQFELKGGTSLSKGFGIIERFSEDIDIQIYPDPVFNVRSGKNHNKLNHIESRRNFFDSITNTLSIPAMQFQRDHNFDEPKKMRSGGIRGEYASLFSAIETLKPGIVLELGFDQTTPNVACDMSSWVFDKALSLNLSIIDNRPKQVKCYCPEYTFVEKMQTLSTKYRLQQAQEAFPINFLRHYYDVYQLLNEKRVLEFIHTNEYQAHKERRFRTADEKNIIKNEAFLLTDKKTRALYSKEFEKKTAIYFRGQPAFKDILHRIKEHLHEL